MEKDMKRKQPSLHLFWWVCHSTHTGAEKGAACLPMKADEILTDFYFYLDKSEQQPLDFFSEITNKLYINILVYKYPIPD